MPASCTKLRGTDGKTELEIEAGLADNRREPFARALARGSGARPILLGNVEVRKIEMVIPDRDNEEIKAFFEQVVSLELRVKKTDSKEAVEAMERFGLKYKNSWASMELKDHTVLEFWRKDLVKSSGPSDRDS